MIDITLKKGIHATKCNARKILFENYIEFLFATLFFIGIFIGFFSLGTVYGSLLIDIIPDESVILITLALDIVALLIILPVIFGYGRLCIKLSRGDGISLAALFDAYASRERLISVYSFFLRGIPSVFLRLILPIILASYIRQIFSLLAEAVPLFSGIFSLSTIPCLIILFVAYFLFGRSISSFFIFCGNDFKRPEGKGTNRDGLFRLRASFIPLMVISFFTFGILFVAYTIPVIFISYSLFFFEKEEEISFEDICTDTITFDTKEIT